jgi:hypothetical protein
VRVPCRARAMSSGVPTIVVYKACYELGSSLVLLLLMITMKESLSVVER